MQLCWWGMCWSWDLLQAQQVFFHWNISHLQSQNIHTNLPVPALTGASTNWAPYKLPWQVTKLGCKLPSCSSVPLLILWNRLGLSSLCTNGRSLWGPFSLYMPDIWKRSNCCVDDHAQTQDRARVLAIQLVILVWYPSCWTVVYLSVQFCPPHYSLTTWNCWERLLRDLEWGATMIEGVGYLSALSLHQVLL